MASMPPMEWPTTIGRSAPMLASSACVLTASWCSRIDRPGACSICRSRSGREPPRGSQHRAAGRWCPPSCSAEVLAVQEDHGLAVGLCRTDVHVGHGQGLALGLELVTLNRVRIVEVARSGSARAGFRSSARAQNRARTQCVFHNLLIWPTSWPQWRFLNRRAPPAAPSPRRDRQAARTRSPSSAASGRCYGFHGGRLPR